ncbi:MAG: hypothetical protein V4658_09265 [Bacteroidota bacterium]
MKYSLILLALFGLSYCCTAQKNPQSITLKCGLNQVKIDSAVDLSCSFFTDSIVQVFFENPESTSRLQVVYVTSANAPVTAWFNINTDSRAATFSPRSSLDAAFCQRAELIIYYTNGSINIQRYRVNLGL